MTLKKTNKPNSLSILFKGFIIFSLFMFFTTKPFIKKAITSAKNSVELFEEKERSAEENESDKESELFETDLPSQLNLAYLFPFCFELNQQYCKTYLKNFKPKICTPPPKFV